jgi:hypothetical protein
MFIWQTFYIIWGLQKNIEGVPPLQFVPASATEFSSPQVEEVSSKYHVSP